MKHKEWTRTGRIFEVSPGRRVWKSAAGQLNVDNGDGTYSPYVWDLAKKTLKVRNAEIRLVNNTVEFWQSGVKDITAAFAPQQKTIAWSNGTVSVSDLTVVETKTEDERDYIDISYKLISGDTETDIEIRGGAHRTVQFGFKNKAKVAGEHRLHVQFDKAAVQHEVIDKDGKTVKRPRYKIGKSQWMWDEAEDVPEKHKVDLVGNLSVAVGEDVYVRDEVKEVKPDSWGDTNATSEGFEYDVTSSQQWYSEYDNIIWAGDSSGAKENAGSSFTYTGEDLEKEDTFNSCYYTSRCMAAETNVNIGLRMQKSVAAVWSASNLTSGSTWCSARGTANHSLSTGIDYFGSTDGTYGVNLGNGTTSDLYVLIDAEGDDTLTSGDIINICIFGENENNDELGFDDEDGSNPGRLMIDYTLAGAVAGLEIEIARHHYAQMRD